MSCFCALQGKEKLTVKKLTELRQTIPEIDRALSNIGDAAIKYMGELEKPGGGPLSSVPPVRVTVTGAAGAIGYSLLFRIARFVACCVPPGLDFDLFLVICVAVKCWVNTSP